MNATKKKNQRHAYADINQNVHRIFGEMIERSEQPPNRCHAVSLHMFHYNFIRVHQTIRQTPAMAAGIMTAPWSLLDLVGLIEARECEAAQAVTAN